MNDSLSSIYLFNSKDINNHNVIVLDLSIPPPPSKGPTISNIYCVVVVFLTAMDARCNSPVSLSLLLAIV